MIEGSPNNLSTADPKRGSRSAQSDANSLFRKILAASPSESRFCPDPAAPATRKPLRMNTLVDPEEKNSRGEGDDIGEANRDEANRGQTGRFPVVVDKTWMFAEAVYCRCITSSTTTLPPESAVMILCTGA